MVAEQFDAEPTLPVLHVLVVDDHPDTAESEAQLLRYLGYCVRTARTGPQAVAAAQAQPPDVVLMDLGLPGMDGYLAAAEIRRSCPHKPLVIAVTGFANVSYRRRCSEEGFDHFLVKPCDPDALATLLKTHAATLCIVQGASGP